MFKLERPEIKCGRDVFDEDEIDVLDDPIVMITLTLPICCLSEKQVNSTIYNTRRVMILPEYQL